MGHRAERVSVSARALVLSDELFGTQHNVALLIVLPDGQPVYTQKTWTVSVQGTEVLRTGWWFPVLLDPAQPDGVLPDAAHIPLMGEITGPIAEALGAAPVAKRVEPDEWRVGIALRYAEDFIAASGISASQADAIRARLRLGV